MDDGFEHLERGFEDLPASGHEKHSIKTKHKPIERDEKESHLNF